MSYNRGIGDVEFLNKRIPKNVKYEHVKTRLDTGCSATKYMEKLEEIKRNYRYRKDEIFKRLKVTTFAQLVLQVAYVSDLHDIENDGEPQRQEDALTATPGAEMESPPEHANGSLQASPRTDRQDATATRETCPTARSTLLSVISGMGELNLDRGRHGTPEGPVAGTDSTEGPYPDCPYLLLDVRDREHYDCCHVISAHSFPAVTLSRTVNPYTRDVLEYKNAAGKIIIVYDEDERLASQAATTMCERGFENLFMLSGGLKVVAQKFPEGMTTGSIPTSCLSSPTTAGRRRCPPRPPPPSSQAAERRWRFTQEELDKIQARLDEILLGSNCSSRASSRMSNTSSQSKSSSARSRMSSSSSGGAGRGDAAAAAAARVHTGRPWK